MSWPGINDGTLLQLTFDISGFRILPDRQPHRTYRLEIEDNNRGPRARAALTRWAGPVSGWLGAEPSSRAESGIAAETTGRVPAG